MVDGVFAGTEAIVDVELAVGAHEVLLSVNDGEFEDSDATTATVHPYTPYQLVLDITDGEGDSGGSGVVSVLLSNSDEVAGFQMDISDDPDWLSGVGVETGLSGFTVSGNEVSDGYRVIGFSMTGDVIPPGDHTLFSLTYDVSSELPDGLVDLFFTAMTISDPVGNAMEVTGMDGGTFTVHGYEVPDLILNVNDSSGPAGGTGEITVSIINDEQVGGFQLDVADIPDWLTGQGVTTTLNGFTVSANEVSNGYRVLGFSMTGDVIEPGTHDLFTITYAIQEGVVGDVSVELVDGVISDPSGIAMTITGGSNGIFTVFGGNQPPVAEDITVEMLEDETVVIALEGYDPDGDEIEIAIASFPENGTLSGFVPSVTYIPNSDWYGVDSFDYSVSDGEFTTVATVTIVVNQVFDAPTAGFSFAIDGFTVYFTDESIPGDLPIVEWMWSFGDGASSFEQNPTHTYEVFGAYTVILEITDESGLTSAAEAEVTILPLVHFEKVWSGNPYMPMSFYVIEAILDDYNLVAGDEIAVFDGDLCVGVGVLEGEIEPPFFSIVASSVDEGGDGFTNGHQITYLIWDASEQTEIDNILPSYVNCGSGAPIDPPMFEQLSEACLSLDAQSNIPPIADSQDILLDEDTSIEIILTGSDEDGDLLTFEVVNQPVNGLFADGIYTPNANFNGSDQFTFVAFDGSDYSEPATVSIVVTAVNDAPVVESFAVVTQEDTPVAIELTGYDVDGDVLTFAIVEGPSSGTFADGIYTPNENYFGNDAFAFVASDGELTSEPAVVSIEIVAVNDAPIAYDLVFEMNEDEELVIEFTGSDVEGDALEFGAIDEPQNGTLVVAFSQATYTPNADYFGEDSFSYVAFDGELYSEPALVTILVTSVNDAPIADAGEDQFAYADDSGFAQVTLDGSGSSDIDGIIASYDWTWDGGVAYGEIVTVSLASGATLEITLTITDDEGATATDILFVTVPHFTKVWSGNPYMPMSFFVTAAMMDEIPLGAGDEIAVYDGDLCVGAGYLESGIEPPFFSIVASRVDEGGDGFTEGNEIFFRIWDVEEGVETEMVMATYVDMQGNPIDPPVFAALGDAVVELVGITSVTQVISLTAGWNIFSTVVEPDNADMLNVMQSLIDAGILVKVIDETGASVIEFLGNWINGIGDISTEEGYYIKVSSNVDLVIEGPPAETPADIPLAAGWNIFGYPIADPQDGLYAVQPLIDADALVKVIDETGASIIEFLGNWINSIGNFEAGEGYYIKVTENTILTLDEPTYSLPVTDGIAKIPHSDHFDQVFSGNPFKPMTFYITDATIDGLSLEVGDEVAIYDGDRCVGARTIENYDDLNRGNFWIATSQDDGTSNGFTDGSEIACRIWDRSSDIEFDIVEINFVNGAGEIVDSPLFNGLGTAFAGVNALMVPDDFELAQNYPNPFNPTTTIEFALPGDSQVVLNVYNIQGQLVATLVDGMTNAGYHSVVWDGRDMFGSAVSSGVYFYRISGENGWTNVKKMILLK